MLQAKISAAFFTANGGFSTEGGDEPKTQLNTLNSDPIKLFQVK